MNAADKIFAWLWSILILIFSGIETSQKTIGIVFVLALGLVLTDFITGSSASFVERYRANQDGITLKSRRMRWSFAKLAEYCLVIAITLLIGHSLSALEASIGGDGAGTLLTTLFCVKVEAWIICWIEAVSIVENLRRIFRKSMFLEIIHYMLAVEFVKKIPKLSDFFKERDKKGVCEEFENKNNESDGSE